MNNTNDMGENILLTRGKGLIYLTYISIIVLIAVIACFIAYARGSSSESALLTYLIYSLIIILISVTIAQSYILNKLKKIQLGEDNYYTAYMNPLTGLPTQFILIDRLNQYLLQARDYKQFAAVMILDVDKLKKVNDIYGHSVGDKILKELAKRLKSCIKDIDTVSHAGEDHFTFVFPDIPNIYGAAHAAKKILEIVSRPYRIDEVNITITASIGTSIYPLDGSNSETLIKNARAALTRAKEQGRNNYQMYTTAMTSIINERVIMENSLKKAIQKQEFILHYQPIIAAEGEKITGVEALLRWQHPSLGLIIPGKFISVAEETGLIVDIGKWVLMTACRQNKSWQDAGMPKIPVTVNISPLQFYQEDFVDIIKVVLKETGLEACYLELDISETALKNQETAVKVLDKLKNTGIRISIDDFGSGNIPLKLLKKLPVDSLKIDKAFINDLVNKGNDEIAASIISLGHSFDYNITAVGVETKENFMVLKNHNCDRIQGYYFSEPVHEERFAWLMREQEGYMK